jgi:hypothetical protein
MHFILFLNKNDVLAFYINNGYQCTLFVKHLGVMFVDMPMCCGD